jgi:hypothetical protein
MPALAAEVPLDDRQNPVKRFLAKSPREYAYSSANPSFKLDPVPQWLKPVSSTALPQA